MWTKCLLVAVIVICGGHVYTIEPPASLSPIGPGPVIVQATLLPTCKRVGPFKSVKASKAPEPSEGNEIPVSPLIQDMAYEAVKERNSKLYTNREYVDIPLLLFKAQSYQIAGNDAYYLQLVIGGSDCESLLGCQTWVCSEFPDRRYAKRQCNVRPHASFQQCDVLVRQPVGKDCLQYDISCQKAPPQ